MAPCFTTVFLFVSEETTKINDSTISDRERVSSTVLQVWKLLLGILKFTESELYIKVTFNVAVIFNVKVPFRLPKNFQNSPKCQQNDQDKIDAGNLDAVDYISTVALYLHQSSTISTEMVY